MQNEIIYKINNWPNYNTALIQRRNVSIWFDEKSLKVGTLPFIYANRASQKSGSPKHVMLCEFSI